VGAGATPAPTYPDAEGTGRAFSRSATIVVVTDPWGMRQPPAGVDPVAPLPPRLARLAEVQATGTALSAGEPYAQGFPRADELPEVQELMREGWRPLDSAPLHCLFPAAWPPEHRTWIPDRLPRVVTGATTDTYFGPPTMTRPGRVKNELTKLALPIFLHRRPVGSGSCARPGHASRSA
jgi:hypothetical protein